MFAVLLWRSNADVYRNRYCGSFALSPALLRFESESRFTYWYFTRAASESSIVFLYSTHSLFECDLS